MTHEVVEGTLDTSTKGHALVHPTAPSSKVMLWREEGGSMVLAWRACSINTSAMLSRAILRGERPRLSAAMVCTVASSANRARLEGEPGGVLNSWAMMGCKRCDGKRRLVLRMRRYQRTDAPLILCVATHEEGYLKALQASCQQSNIPLEVLGWGETFQGYAWMRNLVRTRVQKEARVHPSRVVFIVDAYDVLLHPSTTSSDLLSKFLSFQTSIVISQEGSSRSRMQDWWARRVFGPCLDTYVNAGLIAGYASALTQLFDLWYSGWRGKGNENDQLLLSQACRAAESWFRANVAIDRQMQLFATSTCAFAGRHEFQTILNKSSPSFLHGNGACDMDDMLASFSLSSFKPKKRSQYAMKAVLHYVPFVWREVVVLLFVFFLVFFALYMFW